GDVDKDVTRGPLLQLALELIDLGSLAADDDAGTRSADDDAQLVARPLDLNRAHARRLQFFLKLRLQLVVFQQQLAIVALHKPARLPRLGIAEAKSIRMNFLTHNLLFSFQPMAASFQLLAVIDCLKLEHSFTARS